MKYLITLFFLFSSNVFAAETLTKPPKIVSSINPIYQIAKFISGDEKNNYLIRKSRYFEDQYRVKNKDIKAISDSNVFFYVSDDLEKNVVEQFYKIKGDVKIVQLIDLEGLKSLSYQPGFGVTITDSNIWLNPDNAIKIAQNIAKNLVDLYPRNQIIYNGNLENFTMQVLKMDEENQEIMSKVKKGSYIIDINRLAYFEDYYQISAATILRYSNLYEPTSSDLVRVKNVVEKGEIKCALANYQEKGGLIRQISSRHKMNLVLIDILGKESVKKGENGYVEMMKDLVKKVSNCAS
ncbi:MAG: zinc transport system substrate-binding protein [Lentimonas sp.]|jgi:zinc transport system substrate-binding protein